MVLPAAGCQDGGPARPVRLAATLPLSSADAPVAESWSRGYRRAIDEINAAGGLLLDATGTRVPLVLSIVDDGGDLPRAEQAAERLLAEGADVLLATPGVIRMAAQAAVAARHGRPYVVPAAAGPDLAASPHAWVLVTPLGGKDDEGSAYQAARAALDAMRLAPSRDPEAVRRAFARLTASH